MSGSMSGDVWEDAPPLSLCAPSVSLCVLTLQPSALVSGVSTACLGPAPVCNWERVEKGSLIETYKVFFNDFHLTFDLPRKGHVSWHSRCIAVGAWEIQYQYLTACKYRKTEL